MLTSYGSAGSGSAAVETALERCAVPYRVLRASSWEADSAQAVRGLACIDANCCADIGVIDFPERWCVEGDEATLERIQSHPTVAPAWARHGPKPN